MHGGLRASVLCMCPLIPQRGIGSQTRHYPEVQADRLIDALESTGARKAAEAALRAPPRVVGRRLHETFDGFRTLKLIHTLRDQGLANLPMREALERATFISMPALGPSPSTGQLAAQVEALDYAPP